MAGEEFWIHENRGVLKVVGGDRVRFLNGQVTNDVSRIPVGEGWYAATCTAKGRMVADFWISNRGEEFWLDTDLSQREVLRERLEKYLIADDVDEIKLLRILNRVPCWGFELSPEILPPEAGMDRNGIRYDKGCYVGQEVMARIKSIGHVSKLLVQLDSSSEKVPVEGGKIFHQGKSVGWITSSILNPLTGKGIALGYVSWLLSATTSEVEVDGLALTIRPEIA